GARALGLVKSGGKELSTGGKVFTWASGHAAGLGGMVGTTQLNQLVGLADKPLGGFKESLVHDVYTYLKYAIAQRVVGFAFQGRLTGEKQRHHKIAILESQAMAGAHMKELGYTPVLRQNGIPVFQGEAKNLYDRLVWVGISRPGFSPSKLVRLIKAGKNLQAEMYAENFGLRLDFNENRLTNIREALLHEKLSQESSDSKESGDRTVKVLRLIGAANLLAPLNILMAGVGGGFGPGGGSRGKATYPHSKKIQSHYLGIPIVTELVSRESIHGFERMAKILRESFLDILISGAEEGIPLKGEVAAELRNNPAARKSILHEGNKAFVRLDAEMGTILELKVTKGEEVVLHLSESGQSPVPAMEASVTTAVQPAVPEIINPRPAKAKPAPTRPKAKPPAPPKDLGKKIDPAWKEIDKKIDRINQLSKLMLPGNPTAKRSATQLIQSIGKIDRTVVPPEEVSVVLNALRESIVSDPHGDSKLTNAQKYWDTLRENYNITRLGEESPEAEEASAPKTPEKAAPPKEAAPPKGFVTWKELDSRIESLKALVKEKWHGHTPAAKSATRLLAGIGRVKGQGAPLIEIRRVLAILEVSIRNNNYPQTTHEEAARQWKNLCHVYELLPMKPDTRPAYKLEATDRIANAKWTEGTWESVEAQHKRVRLKVLNKWPNDVVAKQNAIQLLGWVLRTKEHGAQPKEVQAILDALEKGVEQNTSPSFRHLEARELWKQLRKKYDIVLYERPDRRKGLKPAAPETQAISWEAIDQRGSELKKIAKEKWPDYQGSPKSVVTFVTWLQKVKGQKVPLEEIDNILDVLEQEIQKTSAPDAKFPKTAAAFAAL
ncbi:MAG: hypothetical protein R3257_04725, partial [bacterium]|nr:hypothetical protein [bacterium]